QDAANRMQRLIEDLLAFSRLNNSNKIYENIDLSQIIEYVKLNNKDLIDHKKVTIDLESDCSANVIVFQFKQLMQNIIENAIKFSKSDVPPHIVIKCRHVKG